MAERSIELGVGDVVRIGEMIVRIRSIEGDEVTFEIVSESLSEIDVRGDGAKPDQPPSLPR